jgi:putative transposase
MKKKKKSLPAIREVTDELWKRMAPLILEMVPAEETGRPCANPRKVVDAIIFRIRTGCQWNYIPRVYGDDSTIHRTFQAFTEPQGDGLGLVAIACHQPTG